MSYFLDVTATATSTVRHNKMECRRALVLGDGAGYMCNLQVYFFSNSRCSLVEKCVQCQANESDENEPCPPAFVFLFSNFRVFAIMHFTYIALINGLGTVLRVHFVTRSGLWLRNKNRFHFTSIHKNYLQLTQF